MIHHLSTQEKRVKAVEELVRITKPGGQIFILVWALEQTEDSRRKFTEQENYVDFCNKKKKYLVKDIIGCSHKMNLNLYYQIM